MKEINKNLMLQFAKLLQLFLVRHYNNGIVIIPGDIAELWKEA